jgi:hypothetical protein
MKDAQGHGSNERGGQIAHQTGIYKIDPMLTALGNRTLQNPRSATQKGSYTAGQYLVNGSGYGG